MATQNPRVWFKSISLENVRSFGTKQTINFTDKDGNAARWNVILGDNGTGKTTVLKGLLISHPEFKNHPKLNTILRSRTLPTTIVVNRERIDVGRNDYLISESHYKWNGKSNKVERRFKGSKSLERVGFGQAIASYPATRVISESTQNKNYDAFDVFINGYEELVNAEEWLIQADYISLKAKEHTNHYKLVHDILLKLFRTQVDEIFINIEEGTPKVIFKTRYGDVRLHELSLGYKTLIAWMVDFAKGLLDQYPDSPDPLAEPAVCLVDEIDLHLHPKFQRTIIKFLTETFPNTQFIVTAHSPLIVIAAEERPLDANIILLKREGDQTVVVNDPVDVTNWSVDQVLNSDLFGEVSVRPPETEAKMQRRRVLLLTDERTHNENQELEQLEEELGMLTASESKEALRAFELIGKSLSR